MIVSFSRKGSDTSQESLGPSPIFPAGEFTISGKKFNCAKKSTLSIPIPGAGIAWDDLIYKRDSHGDVVTYKDVLKDILDPLELEKVNRNNAHFDPDLRKMSRKRKGEWIGTIGQVGSALGALDNAGFTRDSLFLFFGPFVDTKMEGGKLIRDLSKKEGYHILFGYLQVGGFLSPHNFNEPETQAWIEKHPDIKETVHYPELKEGNRLKIYYARESLTFAPELPGAGLFDFDERYTLTRDHPSERGFSKWDLFSKLGEQPQIKYGSWEEDHFSSGGRGQELVWDCKEGGPAWKWVMSLFEPLKQKAK